MCKLGVTQPHGAINGIPCDFRYTFRITSLNLIQLGK